MALDKHARHARHWVRIVGRGGCILAAMFLAACGSFLPTPAPKLAPTPTATRTPWPTLVTHYSPTPTATAAPTPTPIAYVVQRGDTLLAIAIRFDLDTDAIMQANGLESAHRLAVGQTLIIPGPDAALATRTPTPTATITPVVAPVPVAHTLREGETIDMIARRYFVEVEELLAANPSIVPDQVQAGDVLTVPVGAAD